MYGGAFTPTEAAAMGAGGAFLIAVARRRLTPRQFVDCLLRALRTSAAIFSILIGALLFGYFLTITQTPQAVSAFLTSLGLGRYGVLMLIMLMYLVLGCVMDAMAMVILTVPIVFPVITGLGFDPIWFGVIIVMTVELGLIHPPVGMNVFVIKSVRDHRHRPPRHPDRLPDPLNLAAGPYVRRRLRPSSPPRTPCSPHAPRRRSRCAGRPGSCTSRWE
jgi:tripartite ATP-independent transporter DctM subunit